MEIKVTKVDPEQMKPKPEDESQLGFGKIFTDHFFVVEYDSERGWHNASIEPLRSLSLDPAAMCFHYGQEIFEGMKAYRGEDDSIYLFRPEESINRMNRSAERLCMAQIDNDLFMEGLKKLVLLEKDWVPRGAGTSLYIRPTMIATETALGVHPSSQYMFYIIASPVGAYYPEGFSPTKIYVSGNMSGRPREVWETVRRQAITRPASMRVRRPWKWVTPRCCGSTQGTGNTLKRWEQATSSLSLEMT
jgi:branched-chain amino acid aminotransferase